MVFCCNCNFVVHVLSQENDLNESDSAVRPNFQLGPTSSVFGEAPEEPPPDYDSGNTNFTKK